MQHAGGGTYDPACLNYTMGELNTRRTHGHAPTRYRVQHR